MQDELVSIIMPARDAAATLDAAVRSVFAQSWPHWELLIVDDGSRDGTVEIARSWQQRDPRIRLCSVVVGVGPAEARNLAIGVAKGRYLAFLDSDDVWIDRKLEHQLGAMRQAAAPISFGSYVQFYDGDRKGWLFEAPATTSYTDMLDGNVMGCLTVMLDRQLLGNPRFDDSRDLLSRTVWRYIYQYIGHEDYIAWMQILKEIDIKGLPPALGVSEPLAFHRLRANSFSASKIRVVGYQFFIFRYILGLSLLSSIVHFVRYAWRASKKRFDRRHTVVLPEFV